MKIKALLAPLLTWIALYGLYLLMVGQGSRDELVAGALVAGVGTALSIAVRTGSDRAFQLRPRVWAVPAAKACAQVPRDVVAVACWLARPQPARIEQAQLQPLPADTATTRAVRVLSGSFAPNRIVIAVARQDAMLVHRLAETRS